MQKGLPPPRPLLSKNTQKKKGSTSEKMCSVGARIVSEIRLIAKQTANAQARPLQKNNRHANKNRGKIAFYRSCRETFCCEGNLNHVNSRFFI